jgi:hypothetical protein
MPATKKSAAYEKGLREGRADKNKPSIEIEINPEGEEEEEMGTEEMDAVKPHSRKRSAKNAKHTTPAADGYGMKQPMDAECGCGGKGRKGKASCDGTCGGYGKKMDRNDALSPQEYLAACDLGIQHRSRAYIRSRLDTAMNLTPSTVRNDLKCGKGSISAGEKCTKGAAQKASNSKPSFGQRAKAAGSLLALGAGTAGQAAFTGAAIGAGLAGNAQAAGRFTQAAAGFGAVKGLGLAGLGAKSAARKELGGAALGAATGSYLAGDLKKGANVVGRARKEGATMTLKRLRYARSNAQGTQRIAGLRNAPLPAAETMYGQIANPWAQSMQRPGRRDSVYAAGFSPEPDQLAI